MILPWSYLRHARYRTSLTRFTAEFNNPSPGVYDFGTAVNEGVGVFRCELNTYYVIERMSVSADVNALDFTASLEVVPVLRLWRRLDNSTIYETGLSLVSYVSQQDQAVLVHSDREGDEVLGTLTGVLRPVLGFGMASSISLYVSLHVYAVDGTIYNRFLRSGVAG